MLIGAFLFMTSLSVGAFIGSYKHKPKEPKQFTAKMAEGSICSNLLEAIATLILWRYSQFEYRFLVAAALWASQLIYVVTTLIKWEHTVQPSNAKRIHALLWCILNLAAAMVLYFG